jgi:hypothetical protein
MIEWSSKMCFQPASSIKFKGASPYEDAGRNRGKSGVLS